MLALTWYQNGRTVRRLRVAGFGAYGDRARVEDAQLADVDEGVVARGRVDVRHLLTIGVHSVAGYRPRGRGSVNRLPCHQNGTILRASLKLDILWRIGQAFGQCAEIGIGARCLLLARPARRLWRLLADRPQMLGPHGHPVLGARRQARDGVPIHARLDGAHLHIVHTHHMLVVRVGRQPRDDRRGTRYVRGAHRRGAQMRGVAPDDHCAGGVPGRLTVLGHAAHANAMRLRGRSRLRLVKGSARNSSLLLTRVESTPSIRARVRSLAFTVTLSTPST